MLRALSAPLYSFRVRIAVVFGSLAAVLCGLAALALGDMMTAEARRASVHSLDTIAGNAARALASGMSQRLLETRVLAESSALWADGLDSPAVAQALARAQYAQRFNAWIGVADCARPSLACSSARM